MMNIQSLKTFRLPAASLKQIIGEIFEGMSKASESSVVFLKIPTYIGDIKRTNNKFQATRQQNQGKLVFKEFGSKRAAAQWLEAEFKKQNRDIF